MTSSSLVSSCVTDTFCHLCTEEPSGKTAFEVNVLYLAGSRAVLKSDGWCGRAQKDAKHSHLPTMVPKSDQTSLKHCFIIKSLSGGKIAEIQFLANCQKDWGELVSKVRPVI